MHTSNFDSLKSSKQDDLDQQELKRGGGGGEQI